MRVSACMIVKNEAPVLESALLGLRGHVSEIVVVDGGSSDGSAAIAERAGARVLCDCGDVSAARNRALRAATGDVCLMIDADEIVQPGTWPALGEFLRERRHPLGRILQVSDTADGVASIWITRLCPGDPRYRYEGSIHEQLVGPGSVGNTGLAVLHSGYRPEMLTRKGTSDRNLRLLRAELALKPDDPYLNYQLGKTLLVAGRPGEAIVPFAAALERAPLSSSYASSLACDAGYALKGVGRPADALAVVRRHQRHFPDYTDLWFLEGLCHLALGDAPAMLRAFEHCLVLGEAPLYSTVQGVGSFRALTNLGLYHELRRDYAKSGAFYERALAASPSFAPALRALERVRAARSERAS